MEDSERQTAREWELKKKKTSSACHCDCESDGERDLKILTLDFRVYVL